jgi:hypothetical protein
VIILYFILLALLVLTIFDSDVGLVFVFAFAFAQSNVYHTDFSTRSFNDNKAPMTISITENAAADVNTSGFDTSDILEGNINNSRYSWGSYCRPCYRNSILSKKRKKI